MKSFTLKLYDHIIERHFDVEANADDEELTRINSPAGFYVVIRNFVISEDDIYKLKLSETYNKLLMRKLLFEKPKQRLILYKKCFNKITDLNKQEFKFAKEKFSKWNHVRQKFQYADEPIQKIKYLENYIYASLEWFKKNKIKMPQIKINNKTNNLIVPYIWNGNESQLNKLYDEVIRLKYIDSIDYMEFKSHFILNNDFQNNISSSLMNFIKAKNILVGLIESLVQSGLLQPSKKWKKTSQNFLLNLEEIDSESLSDLVDTQSNETNLINEGIIQKINS